MVSQTCNSVIQSRCRDTRTADMVRTSCQRTGGSRQRHMSASARQLLASTAFESRERPHLPASAQQLHAAVVSCMDVHVRARQCTCNCARTKARAWQRLSSLHICARQLSISGVNQYSHMFATRSTQSTKRKRKLMVHNLLPDVASRQLTVGARSV